MRQALIDTATGKVVNVIEIEAGANWQPPEGQTVRDAGDAWPGASWTGAAFVASAPSAEQVLLAKRAKALQWAMTAIKDNKTGAPWGVILNDLAEGMGWL